MASNMLAFSLTATKAPVSTHLISFKKNPAFITVDKTTKEKHRGEETG